VSEITRGSPPEHPNRLSRPVANGIASTDHPHGVTPLLTGNIYRANDSRKSTSPKPYTVTARDHDKATRLFWAVPYMRLLGRDVLVRLWERAPSLSSLLVSTAVHCLPADDPRDPWSKPAKLWHERQATISGCSRETVVNGMKALAELDYINAVSRQHPHNPRWTLWNYQLASWLIARKGERIPWTEVRAVPLIYGDSVGARLPWATMPGNVYRHAWLAIRLLRPFVRHADLYAAAVAADDHYRGDAGIVGEIVRERISPPPPSHREIESVAGFSVSSRGARPITKLLQECNALGDTVFPEAPNRVSA
jgi:hypothetical protein